jgi:hypothetical protein
MSEHPAEPVVAPMHVSEYRRQVEAELGQAPQQSRFRELLDQPGRAARLGTEVAPESGSPEEQDLEAAASVLGQDEADPRVRSEALRLISVNIEARPDLVDRLLALLGDADVPAGLRSETLDVLQEISFRLPLFPAKRPEYLATLRSIVDVQDVQLRRRVIGILAREKDEYVQRRLIDGLEHRSRALVPAAKAIQFLGYDIHAEHFPLLRRIVERPPSRAAKREAVRLLAADPASVELQTAILRDRGESSEVRKVSAIALQTLDAHRFEAEARRIALDEDEDEQLRAVAISALALFSDPAALPADDQLVRGAQRLRADSTSRTVRQVTADYLKRRGE